MKEIPKFVPKDYEQKWQEFWQENEIYKFDLNTDKQVFSVDTPPPTVSGKMHIGHAMAYSQTDFIVRYKRMKGYNIYYPFGFDDNGLPTERYVEKKNKVSAKSMPRSEFISLCLDTTKEIEKKLRNDWASLGISPEWGLYYSTINPLFRRQSQLSFVKLYKQGREYRKEAPVLWCPHCQTAIAQVEMTDKEVKSTFNDLIFKVKGKKDLIISTTRPELLPACVTIFVHPDDERYFDYVGKEAVVPIFGHSVKIMSDPKVDPKKGTGAVMCCTFGDQTDMEWFQKYNLELKEAILPNGRMSDLAGPYASLKVKDAREKIIADLKEKGFLISQKEIMHSVNFHERCDHEIEIINTKQWFIKYLDLKDEFITLGRKIKWHPEFMRHRYENWINGLSWDWCISRQRFFGIPFPVWYCKSCGETIVADAKDLPLDPTISKPPVDKCPHCGGTEFVPDYDVMDTWATSSLTPLVMSGWESDEELFKKIFPMSLRSNGHDIISFWLFNSIVKSYLHTGKLPWKEAMINGYVLDPKGNKMSKSKGNVKDPADIINLYSADILRYWAASNKFGDDIALNEMEFTRGKKFVNKLWNASKLVISSLEGYEKKDLNLSDLTEIDKWLISSFNYAIRDVTAEMENFEFSKAKAIIENFFWHDFCDNYLEIVKDRFYSKENYEKSEILSAQFVLYNSLLGILKVLSPFVPHITEEIYQLFFRDFEKDISIHISKWPEFDEDYYDLKAFNKGDLATEIISIVRKYKAQNHYSMKEKISEIIISADNLEFKEYAKDLEDVIKTTLSVSKISFKNYSKELTETEIASERFNLKIDFVK